MSLSFILIPFLIDLQYSIHNTTAYNAHSNNQHDTTVSEFDVLIKSTFAPKRGSDIHMDPRRNTTSLSLKLFCYVPQNDRMRCRTGIYSDMYPMPSTMVSSSRLRIRPDAFDNLGNPFEILFDHGGAHAFRFNRLESKQMVDMYRMIGNMLNIGAKVNGNDANFRTEERSTLGYCDTGYLVVKQTSMRSSDYKKMRNYLTFLGLRYFRAERILISKNRNISSCQGLSHYIFAPRFWPEFVPPSSIIEMIKKSQSLITIFPQFPKDGEIIQSQTENFYDFLDATWSVVGSVDETIILKLKSVHLDKKIDQFVGIRTTKELDVVNANEIFY